MAEMFPEIPIFGLKWQKHVRFYRKNEEFSSVLATDR